ncbi:MAG TPA: hypothetical protein VGF67_01095 [Ktedonobacteraceae bacterium]|jgi:hypothetical protein
MGAFKEGQKRIGKGREALVKRLQRWLARKCIADEDHDTLDEIIGSHAGAGEANSLFNARQNARLAEDLGKRCHFSHPMGSGRHRLRRSLDGDG